MNYKNMTDVELLMEKSHMEQLGYVGEVQLLEIMEEIANRKEERKQLAEQQEMVINVWFEEGYRWSVNINDGESVDTNMNKVEAMDLARLLKRRYPTATINEQKLTRAERKQNISYLHENGYSYDRTL